MADKSEAKSAEKVNAEVQSRVDKESEQGFRGVEVDQTPNEHYSVAGVLAGKPTPEGPHADKASNPNL